MAYIENPLPGLDLPGIKDILPESYLSERILKLLRLQQMRDNDEVIAGYDPINSNCIGTLALVLGIEDLLIKATKEEFCQDIPEMLDLFVGLQYDRSTPGSFEPFILEWFLDNSNLVRELPSDKPRSIYDIVAFYARDDTLQHAGIYLGENGHGPLMFHQSSTAGRFEPLPIEKCVWSRPAIITRYFGFSLPDNPSSDYSHS